MSTTTFHHGTPTLAADGQSQTAVHCPDELLDRYQAVLDGQRMSWTEHLHLTRRLGSGGQGVVYLSQRRGTDKFTLPVALKIFSPARYEDARSYEEAMGRIAQVAARVAQIQQDNLLDVHNFVDRNRIRIMEMEWVDGYDLGNLLDQRNARPHPATRQQPPLGISEQRDRHRRADPAPAQAGRGRGGDARMPGGLGRAASRRNRAQRSEALEYHDQADRQRQDRRHRIGLRTEQPARPTHLHPQLCRDRDSGRGRLHSPLRPGQSWATS